MSQLLVVAADLVAIVVLTFGLYFPRHHRRDLVVAFLGVNTGVLAVSLVLGSASVGVGLGLGLFGVLSIIRLRSDEIAQYEIAYYFASLALGLLAGLSSTITPLVVGLMALVVGTLYAADHPRPLRRHRQQLVRLDVAHTDEAGLRAHLEALLGATVLRVTVKQVDLVNDTTLVEVRHLLPAAGPAGQVPPVPHAARPAAGHAARSAARSAARPAAAGHEDRQPVS